MNEGVSQYNAHFVHNLALIHIEHIGLLVHKNSHLVHSKDMTCPQNHMYRNSLFDLSSICQPVSYVSSQARKDECMTLGSCLLQAKI